MKRAIGLSKAAWIAGLAVVVVAAAVAVRPAPETGAAAAVAVALNPSHECSSCHGVHGATAGSQLLNNSVVEALCLSCHGPTGPSTLKADTHRGRTCTDCHVPHSNVTNWLGGTNLKLVRDTVLDSRGENLRPVVFESRGTDVGQPTLHSFCDQDEDGNNVWDGVCATCHNNASGQHNYTDPDPKKHKHNAGRTCTICHEHVSGFLP
jgi:predicted CXXCH cytochrome family protein